MLSNDGMEKPLKRPETGRPYAGVSHDERSAERRGALIRAATEVFGTVGFRKATVRAICKAAQLNDRYFYAAFDNTGHLLRATYQHHVNHVMADLKRVDNDPDASVEDKVTQGLRAYFNYVRDACIARVLLVEVMGVDAETDALYQRALSDFGKQIMSVRAPKKTSAKRNPADERIVAIALVGSLTNAATAWLLTAYRDPLDKLVRDCKTVVLGTFNELDRQNR